MFAVLPEIPVLLLGACFCERLPMFSTSPVSNDLGVSIWRVCALIWDSMLVQATLVLDPANGYTVTRHSRWESLVFYADLCYCGRCHWMFAAEESIAGFRKFGGKNEDGIPKDIYRLQRTHLFYPHLQWRLLAKNSLKNANHKGT